MVARYDDRDQRPESDMGPESWTTVDRYLTDLLLPPDRALAAALSDSAAAGLPAINVSPPQGKLLHLLARIHGAKNVLEIGTLGGYSTIWLARALPSGGRVITLEYDPKHAAIARKNIERAGLADIVELRLGAALETLPKLAGPFDLIFIDADKPSTPDYFMWALKLSRPGSLIIIDNVVRSGGVADPKNDDANVRGVRRALEMIAAEPRVTATAIQTVGSKGYDGFAIALVKQPGKG
jgi:predicted O-methyltransferase YrrM